INKEDESCFRFKQGDSTIEFKAPDAETVRNFLKDVKLTDEKDEMEEKHEGKMEEMSVAGSEKGDKASGDEGKAPPPDSPPPENIPAVELKPPSTTPKSYYEHGYEDLYRYGDYDPNRFNIGVDSTEKSPEK